jgi:hypothetical protein
MPSTRTRTGLAVAAGGIALSLAAPGIAHAQSDPIDVTAQQLISSQSANIRVVLIIEPDALPDLAAAEPAQAGLLTGCTLSATITDPDGALGTVSQGVPCAAGTYTLNDPTADGVDWHAGDTDYDLITLTGVDLLGGLVVLDIEDVQVTSS